MTENTARITNNSDIPLALAVWLVHDEYDYIDMNNYISVTTLMRPIKQIILPSRIKPSDVTPDVDEFISRALGNAIHDSVEKAWHKGYKRSLKLLGFPDSVIERVLINPTQEELALVKFPIPVYLEQRMIAKHGEWNIGGKFDQVTEGIVNDTKSTSAYTWVYGTRDDENRLQGSLYRWLDSKQEYQKITEDFMQVNYVFTDWQKVQANSNPNYPQKRVEKKTIPLLGLEEIEDWIDTKLTIIKRLWNTPEDQLPECTDEELWRSEPKYKYFSNPAKTTGRSTKNFNTLLEANQYRDEKGKGVVIAVPGEVKRCGYCPAFEACSQKDRYFS